MPRPAPATAWVLLAAAALVAHWCGLMLLVGSRMVPGWASGAALLGAALVARRAEPTSTGRDRWRWALGSLTAVGCLLSGGTDVFATYHLLDPAGPGGCRAFARETAILFAGGGEVYTGYAVGPVGVAWEGSSWTADDGYRPIAAGTYRLTWGLGGGSLVVEGTGGNPVWPALHGVDCG
ncbi:hypothetical protein [Actinoplanes sp. CA-252034]|uniref:hypothetical protein n=1 Tax=Actinoplanes sp. CA-252034 TaxID=3239906 RepID=UPI003D988EF9